MIGVVTGFRAEARCLPAGLASVVCSGAEPERARHLAGELVAAGASLLISFGVAGALGPGLVTGDLVLPEAVLTPDDRRLACDVEFRTRLAAALTAQGIRQVAAPLLAGSGMIVSEPAARRALFARTGATAVDMESHAVAEAAAAAGRPFLVIRAIADTADDRMPSLAAKALRPDGSTDVSAVLRGLLVHPGDLPDLLRLATRTRRALRTLARTAPALETLLGSASGAQPRP